jgi:hypothetical protein
VHGITLAKIIAQFVGSKSSRVTEVGALRRNAPVTAAARIYYL